MRVKVPRMFSCRAPLLRARLGAVLIVAAGAVSLAGCGTGATGFGLDLVSDEQAAAMGLRTWQEILATSARSRNVAYQATAQRVASRILEAAGEDARRWEVLVFEGGEANAFALPGRKIGIYEGMLRLAGDEAQLAAVVAHEVAHLEADHPGERLSTSMATELGVDLASALLGGNSGLTAAVLGVGAQYGVTLPYSRNQELEADRLGLRYMAAAGYDPRAAIALWRQMAAAGGASAPSFLSTHPAPAERIEALQESMPRAMALYFRR